MRRSLAVLATTATALLGAVVPLGAANAATGWAAEIENPKASWTDGTLTVRYDWDVIGDAGVYPTSGAFDVVVDGVVVNHLAAEAYDLSTKTVRIPRAAAAGPALVQIRVTGCAQDETFTTTTCTTSTDFSKTVAQVITPPKGMTSALTLLNRLRVTKETHSTTYARTRFKLWVDANHDGENTRAEVLKAESSVRVTKSSTHTVKTGRWLSRYDGKTYTVASSLDIDHVVPLQEAWVSGAYGWSATKRTAYANDIGYGASLIAVSAHENRSKGDKEPGGYLPPVKAYRCAYVRNWIDVKSRWGLSVNVGEKHTLTADLATYCATPWVKAPPKPSITALVGSTPSSSSSGSSSSGSSTSSVQGVHPGAFCSPGGAYGYTVAGTRMQCKTSATDSRNRWRAA
jgi:hypothetical protein